MLPLQVIRDFEILVWVILIRQLLIPFIEIQHHIIASRHALASHLLWYQIVTFGGFYNRQIALVELYLIICRDIYLSNLFLLNKIVRHITRLQFAIQLNHLPDLRHHRSIVKLALSLKILLPVLVRFGVPGLFCGYFVRIYHLPTLYLHFLFVQTFVRMT